MDSPLLIAVLTVFVAAAVNGGLGYGFSSISVPVLLLSWTARILNPALVLLEVFLNLVALVVNRRGIPRVVGPLAPVLAGAVPGVLVGSWVLSTAPTDHLKLATYGLLLPITLIQSLGLRCPMPQGKVAGVPVGAGIGVLYAATTISGPPLAAYLNNQGLAKDDFRAALSLFRVVEASLTAAAYAWLGLFTAESASLATTFALPVLLGLPLGHFVLRRMQPETFRRVCMATDAVLVTFGLSRVATDALHLVTQEVGLGLVAAVALFEAVVLSRHFSRSAAATAGAVPAPSPVALDFPVALRLEGRPALVVGAGPIATGRIRHLLESKAQVTVVAPSASPEVQALAAQGALAWHPREFFPGDCAGAALVFAATSSHAVNAQVAAEARAAARLVNVADSPELCDFHVPSIGRQGVVTVAVSTAGQAPGLARHVRARAMSQVTPAYGTLARLIGRVRRLLAPGKARAVAIARLVDGGAAQLLERGDGAGLRRLLRQAVEPARQPAEQRSRP